MTIEHDDTSWLVAGRQVTIVELSRFSGLTEEDLRELVECGALSPADPHAGEWAFSAECVALVRKAARLRADLELDVTGVALVLSFLETIDRLEADVRQLSAQLARPPRP